MFISIYFSIFIVYSCSLAKKDNKKGKLSYGVNRILHYKNIITNLLHFNATFFMEEVNFMEYSTFVFALIALIFATQN